MTVTTMCDDIRHRFAVGRRPSCKALFVLFPRDYQPLEATSGVWIGSTADHFVLSRVILEI